MNASRLAVVLFIFIISTAASTLSAQMLRLANLANSTPHTEVSKLPTHLAPKITVVVADFAHVERSVLLRAEKVAAEIFRDSGVETEWFDCSASQECDVHTEGPQFRLAIHSQVRSIVKDNGQARGMIVDHTLGFAIPCSTADSACLAYIFYSPISNLAAQYVVSTDRILGHVMAHEIGHALLGPNAHTRTGIMQGRLPIAEMERLLYFTSGQSRLVRSELLARAKR
jgi:hypothetical protein